MTFRLPSDRGLNVAIAAIARFASGFIACLATIIDAWADLDKVDNDACPSDDQEQIK